MSFIILKNNNEQPANAFSNKFTNTLTIPENSEVALHSISINRLQQYAVEDWKFYVYHGPALDEDGDPTDGGVASVQQPIEINLQNGSYTVDTLAAHIQEMLRQQDPHPNYQQSWVVTKKMSTDGSKFEGFNLECDQIAPVA
jgi:hypothetical protein